MLTRGGGDRALGERRTRLRSRRQSWDEPHTRVLAAWGNISRLFEAASRQLAACFAPEMLTRTSSVTRVRANPPFGVGLARRAGPRRALPRVSAAASSSPAGAPRPSQASSRASKPDRHFSFDQNHDAQFLHWLDDLRVAAEKETWSAIPALVRFPRAEPGVALALAARAGQSRLVRTILASRGDAIDASDPASAGVAAAARGRVAVLGGPLEHGLAPDAADEHGVAVPTVAAGAGPGPTPSPARTSRAATTSARSATAKPVSRAARRSRRRRSPLLRRRPRRGRGPQRRLERARVETGARRGEGRGRRRSSDPPGARRRPRGSVPQREDAAVLSRGVGAAGRGEGAARRRRGRGGGGGATVHEPRGGGGVARGHARGGGGGERTRRRGEAVEGGGEGETARDAVDGEASDGWGARGATAAGEGRGGGARSRLRDHGGVKMIDGTTSGRSRARRFARVRPHSCSSGSSSRERRAQRMPSPHPSGASSCTAKSSSSDQHLGATPVAS